MSRLIIRELKADALYQQIVPTENLNLVHIRPHLLIYGSPSGTLQVQVRDSNDRIAGASNTISISTLKTQTYAHGYFRFDITQPLISGVTYRIALVGGGGYTFSETDYVGWASDWNDEKISTTYTQSGDVDSPLDFELWVRKIA